jgi:hypothetical protein
VAIDDIVWLCSPSGQLTNMVSAAESAHTNDEHVLGPDEKKSMPFVFFSCQ